MSNITVYKKPELARLEEKYKFRELSQSSNLMHSKDLITWLIDALGVKSSDERIKQQLTAIKMLPKIAGSFSPDEIKKAFELYVSHELNIEVKVIVTAKSVGEIVRAYQKYKNEKLKNYRLKMQKEREKAQEPTSAEIALSEQNSIDETFQEYLSTNEIPDARTYVYDILFRRGELPKHTPEFKERIRDKAIKLTKAQVMTEKQKDATVSVKNMIDRILSGKEESRIRTNAKRYVLAQYFEKKKLGL